jgi:hypothetical protein
MLTEAFRHDFGAPRIRGDELGTDQLQREHDWTS